MVSFGQATLPAFAPTCLLDNERWISIMNLLPVLHFPAKRMCSKKGPPRAGLFLCPINLSIKSDTGQVMTRRSGILISVWIHVSEYPYSSQDCTIYTIYFACSGAKPSRYLISIFKESISMDKAIFYGTMDLNQALRHRAGVSRVVRSADMLTYCMKHHWKPRRRSQKAVLSR